MDMNAKEQQLCDCKIELGHASGRRNYALRKNIRRRMAELRKNIRQRTAQLNRGAARRRKCATRKQHEKSPRMEKAQRG